MKCDEYLNSIMNDERLLAKYKNVKLLKWMSEKLVYGVMTYKGETFFELDEDDYYVVLWN